MQQAIQDRQSGAGLVHHSDRGSHASNDYVKRLEEARMVISMSRPARPWEKAYCESFMSTLKREQISCPNYAAMEDLRTGMTEFIDQFYKVERLHSALAYCSPAEFENKQGAVPPAGMSFQGMRKSILMLRMLSQARTQQRAELRPPLSHQDGFPADYSSAGCSPAVEYQTLGLNN